jgi:hypothetical protein
MDVVSAIVPPLVTAAAFIAIAIAVKKRADAEERDEK